MTVTLVSELIHHALMNAFWISLPLLAVGFVVGIAVSLIQVVTSIQDSSFSAVPRLAAFLAAFIALMPWMVNRWTDYARGLFADLGHYVR